MNKARRGVDPPDSATANRPDPANAAPARATNCSAAFRASSSASWQILMSRLVTGKKCRVVSGAAQGSLRIQNNLNRCRRQKIRVPPLIDETFHECAVFEFIENLRRDAAADVKPAHRFRAQREITRFRAVNRHEE